MAINNPLSDLQKLALRMLLNGEAIASIMSATGKSRKTIERWRKLPEFQAAIVAADRRVGLDAVESSASRLGRLKAKSLDTIEACLDDESQPMRLKLQAAALVSKWEEKIEGYDFDLASDPDRVESLDRQFDRVFLALTRRIEMNLSNRPLSSADLKELTQAYNTLARNYRSARGDIGCAIGVFTEAGLMPEEYAPQLLDAIEQSEEVLKSEVQKMFSRSLPRKIT